MKVLGVIIARGGSKRLKGKNLRLLGGKPLIAWSVAAATAAQRVDRTIVSTDDIEIAEAARAAGAVVPFLRPPELATDLASPVHVLSHAAATMDQQGFRSDAVVLLQATSPFRSASLIDAAVERFQKTGADTLTSVRPAPAHPFWIWRQEGSRLEPYFDRERMQTERSMLPDAFIETGTIYVARRSVINAGTLYGNLIVPLEVGSFEGHDIDTLDDLKSAEVMLATRQVAQP